MIRTSLLALAALLVAATVTLPAAPAHAGNAATFSQLQTQLNAGGTVLLTANITVGTATSTLNVPQTATLDLRGFNLTTNSTVLTAGKTLTVTDSVSGGLWRSIGRAATTIAGIQTTGATLIVDGASIVASGGPATEGIGASGNTLGGTVTINSGTVTATGGTSGAGIGGSGSTTTINGGTVTAQGSTQSAGIGGYVGRAASVTITGGIVNATGGAQGPGIGHGAAESANVDPSTGGTVTITGGTVTATGGAGGAGIGGGLGGSGGAVSISGGTITAVGGTQTPSGGAGIGGGGFAIASTTARLGNGGTINISAGTVTATGGEKAAGIGGGNAGASGNISIGAAANVTATGGTTASAIGRGINSTIATGTVSIAGTLTVPSGTLAVPASSLVTIASTGLVRGAGTVTGAGSIVNNGIIQNQTVVNRADTTPGIDVSVRDYKITFNRNYPGGSTTFVRVYAPTFIDGDRTMPELVRPGYRLTGWNTAANGSGTTVTTASALTADRTLFAQWTPSAYTLSPATSTVSAGSTVQFSVSEAWGPDTLDVTSDFAFTSSDASDAVAADGKVTFTKAGSHTVTATLIGNTSFSYQATVTVNADTASTPTISLTPAASSVVAGSSVAFTVSLTDPYGNAIPSAGAVLTSDTTSDVVTGTTVTFTAAGTHTITATVSGVSATATVTVTADAANPSTLTITPAVSSIVAGESLTFDVVLTDIYGNVLPSDGSVLSSSVTSDVIVDDTVTFTAAGTHTITASLDGRFAMATIDVVADQASPTTLTMSPAVSSIVAGGSQAFTVVLSDQYGNELPNSAVLTSSDTTDAVTGTSVQFTVAGTRTITATHGALTATATVGVTPDTANPASLVVSTQTPSVTAGDTVAFDVVVTDSYGNVIPSGSAVLTSNDSTDVVSGHAVTVATAGAHSITATFGTLSDSTAVAVAADAANPATITMTTPDLTVDQGDTATLDIVVRDAYGNQLPSTAVVVTSSVATDVIVGHTVTFPTASPHVITATLGGLSTSLTFQVTAAAVPPAIAGLASSGVTTGGLGGVALVLLLGGIGAIVVGLRRRSAVA